MAIFATAGAMVTAALRGVGILSEGEVATGEQINSGLLSLNLLLDELSIDRNMVSALVEEEFALTADIGEYEVKAGADWNTTPPIKIEQGFLRDGDTDYPLDCSMTQAEYNAISDKTISGIPTRLLYLKSGASGFAYFDYLPISAYTAHIFSWKPLTTANMVSTTVIAFPKGYESAIYANLMVKLASDPAYNVPISPILVRQSQEAKARIASMNAVPITAPLYLPIGKGGGLKSRLESGDF